MIMLLTLISTSSTKPSPSTSKAPTVFFGKRAFTTANECMSRYRVLRSNSAMMHAHATPRIVTWYCFFFNCACVFATILLCLKSLLQSSLIGTSCDCIGTARSRPTGRMVGRTFSRTDKGKDIDSFSTGVLPLGMRPTGARLIPLGTRRWRLVEGV